MNWFYLFIIAVLMTIIIIIKIKDQRPTEIEIEPEQKNNYTQSYQKRFLLTKNEWYEYKKLQQYADATELQICPKVRLLDIIEPRKGEKNYMSLLGKVQSKHVDFLICDKNLHVLGVLELDDNSHNRENRKERDLFVDEILESVGYTVVHTKSITETTLNAFKKTNNNN